MSVDKPTMSQERRAYRNAVEQAMVRFYGTPAVRAQELVTGWWNRLSATGAFKSGLFMHSEAINTAGDLAGKEVIRITSENEEAYRRLLTEARDQAVSSAAKRGTVQIWRAATKESNTKRKKSEVKQKHLTASV